MSILNASNAIRFNFKYDQFIDYVYSFYKSCPFYCSDKKSYSYFEIEKALKHYYKNIKHFDSIDRENLKIVIEGYRYLSKVN
jgi:hypothetical protein